SVQEPSRIAPHSMVVAEGRIVWDGATAELLRGHSSASHLMGISAR
ncbi:thiamine ABC transporter ATP-binding protein, partial [Klebsiella pneumoniae]|nr:thiamine ABC transporter ATP-binding protein [Klebsiella pneumoniae]